VSPSAFFASSGSSEWSPIPRQLRVLVVDDEPDTVLSLVTLLRTEGYDTKGVTSGTRALVEVEAFDPDVLIVDIAMPLMTGWDVAREVRKLGRRRVLIAVSGTYIKKPDEMLTRAAGFNYFCPKPCDPSFLFNILAAVTPAP
jgi:two-component system OmpR family response regulator